MAVRPSVVGICVSSPRVALRAVLFIIIIAFIIVIRTSTIVQYIVVSKYLTRSEAGRKSPFFCNSIAIWISGEQSRLKSHLPVSVVRFCVKSAAVSSFAVRPEYRTITTVIYRSLHIVTGPHNTNTIVFDIQRLQYPTVHLSYRTRSGAALGEVDGRQLLRSQSVRRLRPVIGRHLARRTTVRLQIGTGTSTTNRMTMIFDL